MSKERFFDDKNIKQPVEKSWFISVAAKIIDFFPFTETRTKMISGFSTACE